MFWRSWNALQLIQAWFVGCWDLGARKRLLHGVSQRSDAPGVGWCPVPSVQEVLSVVSWQATPTALPKTGPESRYERVTVGCCPAAHMFLLRDLGIHAFKIAKICAISGWYAWWWPLSMPGDDPYPCDDPYQSSCKPSMFGKSTAVRTGRWLTHVDLSLQGFTKALVTVPLGP